MPATSEGKMVQVGKRREPLQHGYDPGLLDFRSPNEIHGADIKQLEVAGKKLLALTTSNLALVISSHHNDHDADRSLRRTWFSELVSFCSLKH
jgi:hypothetical protein